MKFKLPKRCPYCAHKMKNNKCVNPNCIAYEPETDTKEQDKKDGEKV